VAFKNADTAIVSDVERVGEVDRIDGIARLAGAITLSAPSPILDLRAYFDPLTSILHVTEKWKVRWPPRRSIVGVCDVTRDRNWVRRLGV
jgi:hypothetical protein